MFILLLRTASLLCALLLQSADHSIATNFSLPLTEGLNVSVGNLMAEEAIAGYNGGAFLPILSSPGFNSSDANKGTGFSFGFFFTNLTQPSDIYLIVCGGVSGSYSDTSFASRSISANMTVNANASVNGSGGKIGSPESLQVTVSINATADLEFDLSAGSYAVPVWIANTNNPLRSATSSLVVMPGAPGNGNLLALRDQNGTVVWNVSNVGLMEMNDSGNLIIYDTINRHRIVWQSLMQPRDTLVQNQKLSVGMELTANDSSYLARMTNWGLVLYLNTAQFIERPSPSLVIPISYHDNSENELDLLASPCGPNNSAYTMLEKNLSLDLGCTGGSATAYQLWQRMDHLKFPEEWSFLTLATDGRLYITVIGTNTKKQRLYVSSPLSHQILRNNSVDWGECDVPMACGPFGVCTPSAQSLCSCPPASQTGMLEFDFINNTIDSKGCARATPLPVCIRGDEHINTTGYLQMNETASIFLFSGWPFASTPVTRVDTCKEKCSSNCSCTGFFYKVTNTSSACFFITDSISLVHVHGKMIAARSYVTYLKINLSTGVAPSATNNGNHESTIQTTSANNGKHISAKIATAVVSSVVACLLALGLVVYLLHARKQRKVKDKERQAQEEELQEILHLLPTRFSYQDLHRATKGFTKLLGAGGCGSVYAGVLLDGRKIAVKRLESGILKGQQSKQFLAELATVGRTSHQNIVCLVGFCWETSQRLLVYEYMERGSLDQWLFPTGPDPLIDWQSRYNVALGIARGLTYLHEECPLPILHFDIKPQNILLDDASVAKLADFGLSKLMQGGVSEIVTVVRGTPGYIAPEWVSHGAVTKKCDIYSMGMVMLEIVGGRKNVDLTLIEAAGNEWHFPSWAARKCAEGFMLELVDKRIGQAYDKEQACRLILTAFWCIHENASMRPNAPTVLQWLEGSSPIKPPLFSTIANTQSSIEITS